MAQMPVLRGEVGAQALRVRSVYAPLVRKSKISSYLPPALWHVCGLWGPFFLRVCACALLASGRPESRVAWRFKAVQEQGRPSWLLQLMLHTERPPFFMYNPVRYLEGTFY